MSSFPSVEVKFSGHVDDVAIDMKSTEQKSQDKAAVNLNVVV